MRQFIPFEDQWEALPPEALVPYQVGMPLTRAAPLLPGTDAATAWLVSLEAEHATKRKNFAAGPSQ